jgi:hypothetical protein
MENLLQLVRQNKTDAMYGKKRHFNAADRKQNYHWYLGVPLIIGNLLSASILWYVLKQDIQDSWKYIPLFLSLILAIGSSLQTFFNFEKKIEGHKRVGNKYLAIMKRCQRLESYILQNDLENNVIIKDIEDIAAETDKVNVEAEAFPTSKADFEKARKGFKEGEESYTNEELQA